ncbi:MAG TPA: hypothetical protein VLL25_12620, partial [Acidimicrobiales bacterium]|nr:hypothetical protein [Acidimicrobiales bacterium]
EMGPFWVLSFIGVGLSTIAVNMATSWASASGLGATARTLAAEFANVGTFGTLWVVQYVVLDRVLFTPSRNAVVAVEPASAGPSASPAGAAGDAGALKAA